MRTEIETREQKIRHQNRNWSNRTEIETTYPYAVFNFCSDGGVTRRWPSEAREKLLDILIYDYYFHAFPSV